MVINESRVYDPGSRKKSVNGKEPEMIDQRKSSMGTGIRQRYGFAIKLTYQLKTAPICKGRNLKSTVETVFHPGKSFKSPISQYRLIEQAPFYCHGRDGGNKHTFSIWLLSFNTHFLRTVLFTLKHAGISTNTSATSSPMIL